jgi:hypothetical protein
MAGGSPHLSRVRVSILAPLVTVSVSLALAPEVNCITGQGYGPCRASHAASSVSAPMTPGFRVILDSQAYLGIVDFAPRCTTGVEWAPWANNWLVRAEYLNYNFGGVWVGLSVQTN